MGLFDDVLYVLGKAVNIVVYAAGTVVGIAAAGVIEFTQVAFEKYEEYRKLNRSINLNKANLPVLDETKRVNDEIIELESKYQYDGTLNQYDKQQLSELYSQRDDLKEKIRTNKELLMVERMNAGDGIYDSIHVQDINSHILQFHVGQTVFGKRCGRCGKPMVLQWKRGQHSINMADFFWGCIGFYDGSRHLEPFVQSDLDLFTKIDRPEFELKSQQLGNILSQPGPQKNITKRMNGIKQQSTDTYLCPVHNEPMIVREKREADGLLDQYFFGCPRWQPNNNGCNQIVKLKSPAQLASALEAFYGRGIL